MGAWAAACTLGAGFLACAPSTEGGSLGPSQGGGGEGGEGGVASGNSGTTSTGSGNTGASLGNFGGARNNNDGPDAGCARTSVRAETIEVVTEIEIPVVEEVPTVLYFMLDRSGSMVSDSVDWGNLFGCLFGGCPPPPPNKWQYAVDALTAFVQDAGSNGLRAALHYFPGGGNCDGSGYDVPTVPLTALTAGAMDIINSLQSQSPSGNTPTAGALRGATAYCAAFNAANTTEQCVVVLISDGEPTDCDPRDGNGLGAIAQQAYADSNVKTYAVGMDGADFTVMNRIAELGEGDCTPNDPATFACDVTAGSGNTFLAALELIRSRSSTRTEYVTDRQTTILDCEWDIPEPPEGEIFDKSLVNVEFIAGSGSPQPIGFVDSEAACTSVDSGWFYDDPADPKRVKVCSQTCGVVQSVTDAQVNVILGCETEPAIPK
jgi:hypothetical protein